MKMNLQKGLVGHWTMNDHDTDSGIVFDKTPSSNNAVINGASTDTDSVIGDSFYFSGNGDYLDLGEVPEAQFQKGDPFTVSVWVKAESQAADYPMVMSPESSGSTNKIWSFLQNDNSGSWAGTVFFRVNTSSGRIDLPSMSMETGKFYHFVFGYNDTAGEVFQYKNGVKEDSSAATYEPNNSYSSDWTIGSGNSTPEYEWNGNIDDVRIYNRELSEKEITYLYNMRSQRNANI